MARTRDGASPEALRALMREKGLRSTAPRLAVLQSLQGRKMPVSHADLAHELAEGGWDRATIYRNLIDLTEAGLVRRSDLGDHVWRFELRSEDAEHKGGEHAHFMCDACGDVLCLPDESVQIHASSRAPRALRHNQIQIQLKGRCDRCA